MSKIGVTFRGLWVSVSVVSFVLLYFCNAVHGQFEGNLVKNPGGRRLRKTLANIFRLHRDFQPHEPFIPPGGAGQSPEAMDFPVWHPEFLAGGLPPLPMNEFQNVAANSMQPKGPMPTKKDLTKANEFINPLVGNDIQEKMAAIQKNFNNFNFPDSGPMMQNPNGPNRLPGEGNDQQRFPRRPPQNHQGFPIGPPSEQGSQERFRDGPMQKQPFPKQNQLQNSPFQNQGPPFLNNGQSKNEGFVNGPPRNPPMFPNGPAGPLGGAPIPNNVDPFRGNPMKQSGPPFHQMHHPLQQNQSPQQHRPPPEQQHLQPPQQQHRPPQQQHNQSPQKQQHNQSPQKHHNQLPQQQQQQHNQPPQQHIQSPKQQSNQSPRQQHIQSPQQSNQSPRQQPNQSPRQKSNQSNRQQRNQSPQQQQHSQSPQHNQSPQQQQQLHQLPQQQQQQQQQLHQLPQQQQQQSSPQQHQLPQQPQQQQKEQQQQLPEQQQQNRFHRQPNMFPGFPNDFPPNQISRPPFGPHDQGHQAQEGPPFNFGNHADAPHQQQMTGPPNGQFGNNFSQRPRKNPGNQQRGPPPPPMGPHLHNSMQDMPFKEQNFQQENMPFKEQNFQQENMPFKEQNFQQENMPFKEQNFQQGNMPFKEQNFQQENMPFKEQNFQQQNMPFKEQNFQQENTPFSEVPNEIPPIMNPRPFLFPPPGPPPMTQQMPQQHGQVPKVFSDFPSEPVLDRGPWIPMTSRPHLDWRPSADGRWVSNSEEVSSSPSTSNVTKHAEEGDQPATSQNSLESQSDRDRRVFESELQQNTYGSRSSPEKGGPNVDSSTLETTASHSSDGVSRPDLSPEPGNDGKQKATYESTTGDEIPKIDQELLDSLGVDADLESLLQELQKGSQGQEPTGTWYRDHINVRNRHPPTPSQDGGAGGQETPLPFDKHFRSSLTPNLRDLSVDQLLEHFQTKFDEGLLTDETRQTLDSRFSETSRDDPGIPEFTTLAPPADWSQRTIAGSDDELGDYARPSDPINQVDAGSHEKSHTGTKSKIEPEVVVTAKPEVEATAKPEASFDGQLHSPLVGAAEGTDSPNSLGELNSAPPVASSRSDRKPERKSTRPVFRRRKFPKRTVTPSKVKRYSTSNAK